MKLHYTIRYVEPGEYALFEITGVASPDKIKEDSAILTEGLAARGWKRALVDYSEATTRFSISQSFAYIETCFPDFPRGTRHALVDRQAVSEDTDFIEIAARNRGYILKCFADRDAAVKWLIGDGKETD
ncbi:MAG: hypothetical protein GY867_07755 [bacterium]|nr:hypothetical protein [bacterium]